MICFMLELNAKVIVNVHSVPAHSQNASVNNIMTAVSWHGNAVLDYTAMLVDRGCVSS